MSLLESLSNLVDKFNHTLEQIGAGPDKPENFKIFSTNSRLHMFVKAEKLPFSPAVDLSLDLPGEADAFTAQGLNVALEKARAGNSPNT